MRGYLQFSFWILLALGKTASFHSLKSWKSIVVSLGKFLKRPEDVRDAKSVCAITKGGTALKTFADRSAGLSMYMKRKQ